MRRALVKNRWFFIEIDVALAVSFFLSNRGVGVPVIVGLSPTRSAAAGFP